MNSTKILWANNFLNFLYKFNSMSVFKKQYLLALIIVLNINVFAQEKQGNTSNAEIFADIPHYVKKTDLQGNIRDIPVHFFAHDADGTGLNILLQSINIKIKNAVDTVFNDTIKFDNLSDLEFHSLFSLGSLENSNLGIQEFVLNTAHKSSNNTIEFTNGADDYFRISGKYWYFNLNIPAEKLQGYNDIVDISIDFIIKWGSDDATALRVFRTDETIPQMPNWNRGDVHYHTVYTQNAAEIGLPLQATKLAAKEVGIEWITATDHSCDFDNYGLSVNENWQNLQTDIQLINAQDNSFVFIPGIEMSINNSAGGIIHGLVYPSPNSIFSLPYLGDGGGDLSSTTISLNTLLDTLGHYDSFCYAAHPFAQKDKLSFAIGGSVWNIGDEDFPENGNLHPSFGDIICNDIQNASDVFSNQANQLLKNNLIGGQIWNLRNTIQTNDENYNPWNVEYNTSIETFHVLPESESLNHLYRLSQNFDLTNFIWSKGLIEKNDNDLLQNWKFYISAGSDAHGSFNYSNTDLAYGIGDISDNAIGKLSTLAYCPYGMGANGENVLSALKNGQTILSSGPIVSIGLSQLEDNTTPEIIIGTDTVLKWPDLEDYYLITNALTTSLYGMVESVNLFIHTEDNIYQYPLSNIIGINSYNIKNILETVFGMGNVPFDEYFMIRAEMKTIKNYGGLSLLYKKNNEQFRSFTNPIWIKIQESAISNEYIYSDYINLRYTKEQVFFDFDNNNIRRIKIYNSVGKIIMNFKVQTNTVCLNKCEFNSGIYFVKIETKGSTVVKKLVITK